jgi:hypothetical protein
VVFSDERKLTWQIVQMSSVFNIMSTTLTSENKNGEQMYKNINSWRALMARTHYSAAKSMGAKSLGAYIKKEYGVKRLGSSKISDSAVYIKCELLGDNFSQIDTALSELFFKKGRVAVSYDRRSRYQRRIIGSLAKIGDAEIVYAKKNADLEIPSPKVKIKDRILHNSLLRRVGMLIFKKGSKMRRILKRRL